MKIEQVKKEGHISSLFSFFGMGLMFALFALPHSQYELLSDMTKISKDTGNSDLRIAIPAFFTIFVILFSVVVALLGLVSLIVDTIYTLHSVMMFTIPLAILQLISEAGYFFSALGLDINGEKLIKPFNIVTFIIDILIVVTILVTYILFVRIPYLKFKVRLMTTTVEENKKEESLNALNQLKENGYLNEDQIKDIKDKINKEQ